MSIESREYGCLFCQTGKEETVIRLLQDRYGGIEAIAPVKLRRRRAEGTLLEESVRLFPGYVFFRDADPEDVTAFFRVAHVLRLLTYPDDDWRLRGFDAKLAASLFEANGRIGFSTAYFDKGDRIHITEGFLKTYEGSITRVNRRAKTCEVRVSFQGKVFTMWLGFETIEKANDRNTDKRKAANEEAYPK